MNILFFEQDRYPGELIESLRVDHVIYSVSEDPAEIVRLLANVQFDVIFTKIGFAIDSNLIDYQKSLKYVVSPTTGLNHVDIEIATKRNIRLISLKGETEFLSTIYSTAEHTWALILSLTRNLIPAHNSVILNFSWDRRPYEATDLHGKNIGIIGYGRLGKIVSNYALAFGMNVLVNDIKKESITNIESKGIKNSELDDLLETADVVVLLASWSEENNNFFNESMFKKMKAMSYFINTSRGEMVALDSLLQRLRDGHLAGAALDVLNGDSSWYEKINNNHAAIQYAQNNNNLILTPHMGGYSTEAIARTRKFVLEKFINILKS